MSQILFEKLKTYKYNYNDKKDYYFIVMNKNDSNDVIVNSVKGLTHLTSNLNNLPFQVRWEKNKEFKYDKIEKRVKQFIECLQKPQPSWREEFLCNIRSI